MKFSVLLLKVTDPFITLAREVVCSSEALLATVSNAITLRVGEDGREKTDPDKPAA